MTQHSKIGEGVEASIRQQIIDQIGEDYDRVILKRPEWETICQSLAREPATADVDLAALREVARMVVEASDLSGVSGPLGDAARAALSRAAPSGEPAIAEGDLPDRFEAWWASHPQHNRTLATYADKKQIAWDAYSAALSAAPSAPATDGAGEEA